MNRFFRQSLVAIGIAAFGHSCLLAADPAALLETIKSVKREGAGNVEAAAALKKLTAMNGDVLPTILGAFDDANPLAANWLRSAVETIADRELRKGKGLSAGELELFVLDLNANPRARRLAYEWLAKVDPAAAERMIDGMLHDPSPEFRRDAVERLVKRAEALDAKTQQKEAVALYREALSGATDDDQVKAIVKQLRTAGQKVNLQQHFGFLTTWHLIGPFDNRETKGFDVVYPPEETIDLQAKHDGQLGEVQWVKKSTEDEYGILDIAKALENYKGSAMYAYTEYVSDGERNVELRLGTPNAWKVWVNGKLLFGRDEYHRGMALDQYRVTAELQPGPNKILLKICQNEQDDDWAQRFQFQVRVCDSSGIAVLPVKATQTSQTSPQRKRD